MHHIPRLVLAGLSGGSGKTLITLALIRAWANAGRKVRPCKKGPDYIDAAWLSLAARRPAVNLDSFFLTAEQLRTLFQQRMHECDLGIVEGNRGLFDGLDVTGSHSTAELARTLRAPVVLVLDATKMTRTAAALVSGINGFEPNLRLSGVILNRTAGPRHRAILRDSIEHHTDVPVLGTTGKLAENPIPERHMGLWSDQELADVDATLDELAATLTADLDMQRLLQTAESAGGMGWADADLWPKDPGDAGGPAPVIGVVRDAALWFYYPENIEALERAGARIEYLSITDPAPWPEIHGLYLGGGFPETQAEAIAANAPIREHVRGLAGAGLPIYAECGGFMYLAKSLEYAGRQYPMAGVFDVATRLCEKPQGLGYVTAEAVCDTPFHPKGAHLAGHEFHYSHCIDPDQGAKDAMCLKITRGSGMAEGCDGLVKHNTFAAYCHIHALATPHWAPNFVAAARAYQAS